MVCMEKTSSMLVLVIIFSFSFGVATMDMDENSNMLNCPFVDTATICPMNFAEHIIIFQNTFKAISSKMTLLPVLVLAFLLTLYLKPIPRIYSPPNLLLFLKNNSEQPFVNKLLLALSDGRIQPRLYA